MNDEQIIGSVEDIMEKQKVSKEEILKIVYQAEGTLKNENKIWKKQKI